MAFIIPDVKVEFTEVISGYTIPNDISNDLVYCQIMLRQYMGFHQRVIKWLDQDKLRETTGRKVLDDIESEINEIQREQKMIVTRLRTSLEEYYGCLRSENVEVNVAQGNMHVARILARLLGKTDLMMKPINVKTRCTESQLMFKYGLHAIDETSNIPHNDENTEIKIKAEPVELIRVSPPPCGPLFSNKQMSLLKPKSERLLQKEPYNPVCDYRNVTVKPIPRIEQKIIQNIEASPKPAATLPTAPPPPPVRTIENSRLLLLRALNKAKMQNPSSSASLMGKKPQPQPQPQPPASVRTVPEKNHEEPRRSMRSPSSSDESIDLPEAASSPGGSSENDNNENNNVANDQELFLKQFGLYTKEQSLLLSQRRSKRRRRTIQSNEKSDFHYGNLDLSEKRKRPLLLNPAARNLKKRNIESKPTAATTTLKVATLAIDRSSSSSPEQRPTCNECLKSGEEEPQFLCVTCSGAFHMKCHTVALQKHPIKLREKHCPACFRTKCAEGINEVQYQLRGIKERNTLQIENDNLKSAQRCLWKTYKRCEFKLMTTTQRKDKLLKRGQKIKSEMNNLLQMVEDLKNM